MFKSRLVEKLQHLKTPFYYYDMYLLKQTLERLKGISEPLNFQIHYALKANANNKILHTIANYGFGADCVSGNEIQKAIETGFPPQKIVFAGVGKTDSEIKLALDYQIHSFNCESLQEMEVINDLAQERGATARIALRINPDIDAQTHHYITTGRKENKFGIYEKDLDKALALLADLKQIRLAGLHFHIGSQITNLEVFKALCLHVNQLQQWFLERNVEIQHLNLGGGLGINYEQPDTHPFANFENYFQTFQHYLKPHPNQTIHFELGRALVAQCSSLVSRVVYIKESQQTHFAILDAGMTDLIRPALYQSYHKIENLTRNGHTASGIKHYDVVGPICESADCFGKAVPLPETRRGDLIAIRSTGAYSEVLASQYNLRDLAGTIYSDEI